MKLHAGADACILVYARNSRKSLAQLETWHQSFLDKCPVPEDDESTFPFICLGNKDDLEKSTDKAEWVNEDDAIAVLDELCPPLRARPPRKRFVTANEVQPSLAGSGEPNTSSSQLSLSGQGPVGTSQSQAAAAAANDAELRSQNTKVAGKSSSASLRSRKNSLASASTRRAKSISRMRRRSIEILPDPTYPHHSDNRSYAGSLFRDQSIYHTPLSSFAPPSGWHDQDDRSSHGAIMEDQKEHFRLDEEEFARQLALQPQLPPEPGPLPSPLLEQDEYTDDADTMNGNAEDAALNAVDGQDAEDSDTQTIPADRAFGASDGIQHFICSAKTGEGVNEAFEYLARRVLARWKWQDEQDDLDVSNNGRLGNPKNVKKGGRNDSVKVGDGSKTQERKGWRGCC